MEFAFLSLSLSLYPDLVAFVTRGGAEYGTMDKEEPRADGDGLSSIFRGACYRERELAKRENVADRRMEVWNGIFAGEAIELEGWEGKERERLESWSCGGIDCFSVAPETATEELKPRRQNKMQRLGYVD